MNNNILGKIGEDLAVSYLENKGYEILKRNFQNRWGETDIVCRKGETTIFIEVKTRIGEQFGLPENAINKNKTGKLIKNAAGYISFTGKNFSEYRIDAICIVLDKNYKLTRINHYENIIS